MDKIEFSYSVLGLQTTASQADVRRAYRRLAQKFHPDKCKEPDAGELFKMIRAAYEMVKDREPTPAPAADWSHLSRNPGAASPHNGSTLPRPDEIDMKTLKSAVLTTDGWLVPNR